MDRRTFLSALSASAASGLYFLGTEPRQAAAAANDRITVAVIGVKGRGGHVMNTFSSLEDVDVKYVCDIDESVRDARAESVAKRTGRKPETVEDFRRVLDDKSVDAVIIGTPDHWHALPTIYACQAGKDVYVEKPDGHNVMEGRTMVAAAKKHGRVVQLGTQARSGIFQASAMKYISEGHLGSVRFAKAWESSQQRPIGNPPDSAVPAGVNYDLWLGPAKERPFNIRRYHGDWRWFFDYGTGDLGNDGVHRLDVARWALGEALAAEGRPLPRFPKAIASLGGKYYFNDAQQWPDTLMTTYDYGVALLTYEMRIWTRYPLHDESEGAAVYGDAGSVVIGNLGWRAFDERGKVVKEETGSSNDFGHARNFLACMRSREKPNADLETVGHPSSLLCHLGNVAWRAGRTIHFDSTEYKCTGDADADQYLVRQEYRKPWTLPKLSDV